MIFRLATLLVLLFVAASGADARGASREIVREFRIPTYYVTRKDSDFYEVSLKNIMIKTRYCYEYAFSSEAVITDNKLIFLDSDTVCDIEGIYNKK